MEAIDRTFKILELFLGEKDELSISELSKLSGLSLSVTHRFVTALNEKGYLIRKEKKGKYSLGLKFLDFYYCIQRKIKVVNIATPYLIELNKKTDEAVTLGNLDNGQLLVIERIQTKHELRISGGIGVRGPLHSTSIGKLFLAQMTESEREKIFKETTIKKYTKNTKTNLSEMEAELMSFEKEGYVFDREENALGIWSVAAPIYNAMGKIEAGISIIAPTVRITKKKEKEYVELIISCATRISREMGYREY